MMLPLLSALAASWAGGSPAAAQAVSSRPVKLVVPFIAGGPVDALARVVAQHVSSRLGQSMVIENQSGGGGTIGARAVAGAEPDGHTLLFAITSHVYGLYPNSGYDPLTSFAPVATVAAWSHVLVVRPDFPAQTLQDLASHARANPGRVTFGYGSNTPPQMLGAMLTITAGIDVRSIPYRGGAQAIADMLGGRIDMNFGSTSTLLPLIREGKLRAIAFTGTTRSGDLPDVPTVGEAGFPRLALDPDAWAAILAPAGTPPQTVSRLNAAINDGLRSPELQEILAKRGYAAKVSSPQGCAAFLAAEAKKWPPLVKAAGLRAE